MSAMAPLVVACALLADILLLRFVPTLPTSVWLPFQGLALILAARLVPRADRSRRALPLILLIAAGGLSILAATGAVRRAAARPEESPPQAEVEIDADAVQAAFRSLLAEEKNLVLGLPPELFTEGMGRQELFARLGERRGLRKGSSIPLALTVYGPRGEAVAWTGPASVLKGEIANLLPGPSIVQFIRKEPLGTRLFTARSLAPPASRIAVSEIVLDAPSDPDGWRRSVPLPKSLRADLTVEFLDPSDADAALQDFLALGGDRYWKRAGSSGRQLLTAIRNDRGDLLGLLTLSAEPRGAAAAREAQRLGLFRDGILLAAALIALGCVLFIPRSPLRAPLDLAVVGVLIAACRFALLPWTALLGRFPLFDYRLFSVPVPLGLANNPGEALLTALALFGIAGLGALLIRRGGPASRLAGLAAAAVTAAGLLFLTRPWVNDSSLNPAHVPVLPPEIPHVALSWAHALLAFAATAFALAALLPRGRPASLRTIALALLAAGAVSHIALVREAAKVPKNLIETSLASEVVRAKESARERLLDVLGDAVSEPRLQTLPAGTGAARERVAFDVWRGGDLGRTGARSALAIIDLDGHVLSSFAYGLPETIFDDALPPLRIEPGASETPSPQLSSASLQVLSLRVPLLRGDTVVPRAHQPAVRLAVLVSSEEDNLPFLTMGDPLLKRLGARGTELAYDEYFGGAPLFIAYTPSGEALFPSGELAPALTQAPRPGALPVWTTTHVSGSGYTTYLFTTPDGPRAIGYIAPSRAARIAGLLRSLMVLLPLLGLALGMTDFLARSGERTSLSPWAWGRWFMSSYSRRLQAVVLASSLVPLILLAVIFRNTIEQRTRDAVEQAGVQSAATIRRLLEDYVESAVGTTGGSAPIGSRTLFWAARTVHQDIHLFVGDELVATSRGDPEASGLPTFRLDAEVARRLAQSRPPQVLPERPSPGGDTALVYAPVRVGAGSSEGILAVPLVVAARDLSRGGEEVADALLVATFGLGLILSGIGYVFARRLSVPIKDLARASKTIAGGQLSVRVTPRGRDEIRQLVEAFNSMAASLSAQREDLRRRSDYIEAILLNVTTGVISTDAQGIVRTSNPAAGLLLGLPVDLAGKRLVEVLRGRPDLAPVLELWSAGSSGHRIGTPREISIRRDGEELRMRSVVLPLSESDVGVPGSIYLVEDVTEVMRSNRLEAWAEMARRIAHEIKNPLTPIQLSAEHLLRVHTEGAEGMQHPGRSESSMQPESSERSVQSEPPERPVPHPPVPPTSSAEFDRVLHECVDTILAQVRALREISSEFSTYARLPVLRPTPEDLAEVLRSAIAPYRAAPPPGVTIDLALEPLPAVAIDARVFRRAVVNLVENALQALDGGGKLTVTLRRRETASGAAAEIVFADTGEGMDEATRNRIFEPYFSTRDSGTGLGLAIARRAVEEHGGTITVESAPGEGTRMILRLPLHHGGATRVSSGGATDDSMEP